MALATNALTNVTTVEDELGISSGTETARLQRMINIASAMAESYAGRIFYRDTAIEEKVRVGAGPDMFLSRPPINSITSIAFLGSDISSANYEIHSTNGGIVKHTYGSWGNVQVFYPDVSRTRAAGEERKVYTVTYDGGWYTQPQDDADEEITRTLPYDIEGACIAIVSALRRQMGRDPSVVSESLLGSSQTYTQPSVVGGSNWIEVMVPLAASALAKYRLPVLR
jgi:hypothetical protein